MSGRAGAAAEPALICVIRSERVLDPGLAHLLKAFAVVRSSAHSIEILCDHSVARIGERNKINLDVSAVASSRSHAEADLRRRCFAGAIYSEVRDIADNDVRTRGKTSRHAEIGGPKPGE